MADENEERIQFVDDNDLPIGAGTREEAWLKGLRKRVVVVLLTDGIGNILLQKRGESKKVYPGAWTAAAIGHVDEGESYESAALRELKEETGIITSLIYVGKFSAEEMIGDKNARMFNAVFIGTVSKESEVHFEEGEVSEVKWHKISDLANLFADSPEQYTPTLKGSISRFLIHIH